MPSAPVLIAWAVLLAVFGWVYHQTIGTLLGTWYSQDDYQHCFFVPLFSLCLLWLRRDLADPLPRRGSWGEWPALAAGVVALLMFAASALIRWASVYFHYSIDHYSFFPLLIGLTLWLGGWRGLLWAWPSIAFLVFMVPLPGFLAVMLSHPLQRIATTSGVYVIQTLGIPALAQGNVIQLPSDRLLDVATACSGIRMLTLFFAICAGAVLVIQRPYWERAVILISAIPIAIVSNVARIVTAAILLDLVGPSAEEVFHVRGAPWFMMILAMLLLWGETWLMSRLLLEGPAEAPLILDEQAARKRGGAAALLP